MKSGAPIRGVRLERTVIHPSAKVERLLDKGSGIQRNDLGRLRIHGNNYGPQPE